MRTYQALNIGEIRAVEVTMNDNNGQAFIPSAAYVSVLNNAGSTVVAEQTALISSNQVYTIIGQLVTNTVGTYKIVWRIKKDGYTYKHVTDLEVLNL